MKNIIKKYIIPVTACSVLLMCTISSCSKDEYYQDGGKADPVYNGTVMQYLQSNAKFDTIAQIIKLAGMEDAFNNEEITFFAPTDEVIRRTIGLVNSNQPNVSNRLNQQLFNANKDTIKVLSDIPGDIWKKHLMKYIFKGKLRLKDYPQLDFNLRALYPGGYYFSYNSDLSNIGVVYNSSNNVKYTGYRQLSIANLPDQSNPQVYYTAAVASSDVLPKNGVVHILAVYTGNAIGELFPDEGANRFGLGYEFGQDVLLNR
ncbi:fasciclin domain-containing protein [Pedobacter frigoris]|uniref:FAS1 domain-containing protein n=1 Tax=Pedobacter frigoris TaxID=2571272 RepID=A0A4V5P2P5_9SPHI|nr:fasciclin domain-containing protein [Pedobacter frigoris]TKC09182.1 hypothetical protein FA047_03555 [Pedobacter frigoris]